MANNSFTDQEKVTESADPQPVYRSTILLIAGVVLLLLSLYFFTR